MVHRKSISSGSDREMGKNDQKPEVGIELMIRGKKSRLGLLAAGTVAALASFGSHAATVTACGPNICYQYDNAQSAVALTGLPSLVGDAMTWLPPAFIAHSTGGAGWVTATANFLFSAVYTTNPLNEIASLAVHEEFDDQIITEGEVRATLYTQARSLVVPTDGTSTNPPLEFIRTGDSAGNHIDTLDALLTPAAIFVGAANNMQVGIQNTLRAYTASTGDAFIQKKFSVVIQTTNPVPVPGAVWLLGSALAMLGWIRRKI